MATLYFNTAGVNTKWSNALNWWTDSSFTVAAGAIPTSSDDCLLLAGSSDCDWDSGVPEFLTLTCDSDGDAYTGTLSLSVANVNAYGSVLFSSGMTLTSTSADNSLTFNASGDFKCDGLTFPGTVKSAAVTSLVITQIENQGYAGDFEILGTSVSRQLAGAKTLQVRELKNNTTAQTFTFTGAVTMTEGWTGTSTSGGLLGGSLIIDAGEGNPFTCTGSENLQATPLTYVSGDVDASGFTLGFRNSVTAIALDVEGIVWGALLNLSTTASRTITITGVLETSGAFSHLATTGLQTYNGGEIKCAGMTFAGLTSGGTDGTTQIRLTGGDISMNAAATGSIANDVLYAGNVNYASVVRQSGTIEWVSGTLTFAVGAYIELVAASTLDLDGIVSAKLNIASALTLTLASALTGVDLDIAAALTMAGAFDMQFASVDNDGGGDVILVAGQELLVTSAIVLKNVSISSSIASTAAKLTIQAGATQDVATVVATDIDSGDGDEVYDPGGTLLRTINWILSRGGGAFGSPPFGALPWGTHPWGTPRWGS